MKIRHFVTAGLLVISPCVGALAQGTSPSVSATNPKEAADTKMGSEAKPNSATPGDTGKTVVPGSTSTVAGNKAGTAETKAGGGGGGSR